MLRTEVPGTPLSSTAQPAEQMSLEQWVERLSQVELPSLASTVGKIQQLTGDDSHAMQLLADTILQDAAMTTHILRLTSSAYHLRGNRSNSVTRAIVMLGMKEVRSLCLSIAVVGGLVSKGELESMSTDLARAFHGAVQAEQLACAIGDRSPQEIFISTLLFDLGRLIFNCFGGTQAQRLREAREKSPQTPDAEIERQILGFELQDLTYELAKRWGLGELLLKSLDRNAPPKGRTQGVRLGNRFAKAVEHGWESPDAKSLLGEMSEFTGLSTTVLTPMLFSAAERAREVAKEFRATACVEHIPEPPGHAALASVPAAADEFVIMEPDPQFQLTALRDISLKLETFNEVQELIDLVLHGIYRGVGLDRALFAILSPNRKYLIGKSALGYRGTELIQNFKFPLDGTEPNLFSWVIDGQKAVWIEDPQAPEIERMLSESIRGIIGVSASFIAPVMVTSKPIGVVYADRQYSKRQLDVEAFQAFKQFVLTANISLEHFKSANTAVR